MVDVVLQPKASRSESAMEMDMVCHCLEGELEIDQGSNKKFVAKAGDVWSCKKGQPEATVRRRQ